jgi:adenine/guanine phosphoribosyltransferase-like PRPP-binding protein
MLTAARTDLVVHAMNSIAEKLCEGGEYLVHIPANGKVLILDDLTRSGTVTHRTIKMMNSAGGDVIGVI